jgi:hypothetical protein
MMVSCGSDPVDLLHHLPQVQRRLAVLEDGRLFLPGRQVRARRHRRRLPGACIDRRHRRQHRRHLRHAAVDHQLGLVDAAQFLGVRVDVDQALGGTGAAISA